MFQELYRNTSGENDKECVDGREMQCPTPRLCIWNNMYSVEFVHKVHIVHMHFIHTLTTFPGIASPKVGVRITLSTPHFKIPR